MAIGSLVVKIAGDSSQLMGALDEAARGTESFSKRSRKAINDFGKVAAGAFIAVGVAAAAAYKNQAAEIDALAKTADKLGIGVKQLQAMRFAAEQTGVSAGTMDTALQRMTRRVAEAAQGTGTASKALKELGLDAEALKKLAPDESFAEIAEAMDSVASQGDRVRLAMSIFDTEGVALVNTMNGGRDAINGFKNEAELLGLTLSRVDAAKVEAANDSIGRINAMMDGATKSATAEFAPVVGAIAGSIKQWAIESGGFGQVFSNVMEFAIDTVGVFADGIRGIHVIIKGLELGFKGFAFGVNTILGGLHGGIESLVNGAINQVNKLIDGMNSIYDTGIKPMEKFSSASKELFQSNADYWKKSMDETAGEVHDLMMQPLPSSQFEAFVAKAQAAGQAAAEALANKPTEDGEEGESGSTLGLSEKDKEALAAKLEAIRAATAEEQVIRNEKYAADLEALQLSKENELITESEHDELMLARQAQFVDSTIAAAQHKKNAEIALAEAEKQAKIAIAKGIFGDLSSLMNTGSKKMFMIGKAAALSNAAVSGGEAAVSAWKAGMSTGGPWAPAVAAAYTGASLLKTGAMIQQIGSTSFGQKTQPTSYSGGIPTPGTGEGQGGGGSAQGGGGRNISISLVGESFGRDQVRGLIDAFQTELDDGYKLTVAGG